MGNPIEGEKKGSSELLTRLCLHGGGRSRSRSNSRISTAGAFLRFLGIFANIGCDSFGRGRLSKLGVLLDPERRTIGCGPRGGNGGLLAPERTLDVGQGNNGDYSTVRARSTLCPCGTGSSADTTRAVGIAVRARHG